MAAINESLFLILRRCGTVCLVHNAETREKPGMSAVRNVLVVGAGAAGAATAILLASGGVSVDLIDAKPDAGALGSGITLQGNALRILRRLGVWEQISEQGYAFSTLGLRAPDLHGTLI